MKKIELYLMYMNTIKKISQSIDIYFNNLEPEFVVKIHDIEGEPHHFRNKRLKAAIKEACAYLLAESEK